METTRERVYAYFEKEAAWYSRLQDPLLQDSIEYESNDIKGNYWYFIQFIVSCTEESLSKENQKKETVLLAEIRTE